MPVVSLLGLLPIAFGCLVKLELAEEQAARGESGFVCVEAADRSFFPAARLCVTVRVRMPGEKGKKNRLRLCGIPGKGIKKEAIEFTACHCGQAFFEIEKAWVSDYLELFSLPVARGSAVSLFVMPVPTDIPRELFEGLWNGCLPYGEHNGDYVVREYHPGDNPHRIHWKLSVRADSLQVRDLEARGGMTLFLNVQPGFMDIAEQWDSFLDRAYSLMLILAGMDVEYEVMWNRPEGICMQEISDDGDVAGCIRRLMGKGASGEETLYTGNRIWLLEGFHLEEDGKLYFGEQCVYE